MILKLRIKRVNFFQWDYCIIYDLIKNMLCGYYTVYFLSVCHCVYDFGECAFFIMHGI